MNKLFALLLCVGLMAISLPALAEDGNNVPDQLGDILSGKGLTYAGAEVNNIPLPLLPSAFTAKAWADFQVSEIDEGIDRDIRGGIRVAVDWQKLFK